MWRSSAFDSIRVYATCHVLDRYLYLSAQLESVIDTSMATIAAEIDNVYTSRNIYELIVMTYALTLGAARPSATADQILAANRGLSYMNLLAIDAGR